MSLDQPKGDSIAAQANDEPPELCAVRGDFAAKEQLSELGCALNNLGIELAESGRSAEAVAVLREAVTVWRSLVDDPDAHLPDLADSLHNLSLTLSGMGRHQEAVDAMRQAIDTIRQATVAYRDAGPIFQTELLESLDSLHDQLIVNGQFEDALRVIREAVEIRRDLVAEDPDRRPRLADSLRQLGRCLAHTARHAEAVAALEEAVERHREMAVGKPGRLPGLAACLQLLGIVLAELGQHPEALVAAEEAVQIRRTLPADTELAESLCELAKRLADLSRRDEAVAAIEEAVSVYAKSADENADAHAHAEQLRDWLRDEPVQAAVSLRMR